MPDSLILTNGHIYPLNGIVQRVEAVSMRNGCILRLGSNERVRESLPNPDCEIDLAGRAVVPSFSDNLARLGREGFVRTHIDLTEQRNIPEIFAAVEQCAKKHPRGAWIVGFGWNKGHWGWHRFPHRADLDLVSPHHPVVLFSSDHRVAWLNSAAILEVGIRHDTPNPPGGEVERDETTRSATGILKESALSFVSEHLPDPDQAEVQTAIQEVIADYLRLGITRLQSFDSLEEMETLKEMDAAGSLPIRVVSHIRYSDREEILKRGWKTGQRFGNIEMGGVWLQVDGTLISQTAHMLEPYADDWNKFGIEITPQQDLLQAADWCLRNEVMPVFHASGDAACRSIIQVLDRLGRGRTGPGAILVNGDLAHPDDLSKVSRLNVTIATNPRRILAEREVGLMYWGGTRWRRALDFRGWMDQGAAVLFGSGEPLRHWSPMRALSAAVGATEGRDPRRSLTVEEGLIALSRGVEASLREESGDRFASPGQLANLVVLSRDPCLISPEEIAVVEVDLTIQKGEIVYAKESGETGSGT
jgi:hypothetical protein